MDDLFEDCVARVFGFALRLAGNHHEAEDLTQETMLRGWSRRRQLRDPRQLRQWLFQIAVNCWQDKARRQVRRRHSTISKHGPPAAEPMPWKHVEQADEVAWVMQMLETLPDRQRQSLYLTAFEQLSIAEIAEVLGTTPEAIKSSLSLARKRLREKWQQRQPPSTTSKTSEAASSSEHTTPQVNR